MGQTVNCEACEEAGFKEIWDISASGLIGAIYDYNQESLVELICC